MSKNVAGISLKSLEAPIHEVLSAYEAVNEGLLFDTNNAPRLELTPDKPNSARSTTEVILGDMAVATMNVIVFKPGDGSGDESAHKLEHLGIKGEYPLSTKIVPRDKSTLHSELHLNVLSLIIDDVHADPRPFRGSFDLLGIVGGHMITRIGQLGDPARQPDNPEGPATTYTAGYDTAGLRFGDPHAVYNSTPESLQICAFVAITSEIQAQVPDALLQSLDAQMPAFTANQ